MRDPYEDAGPCPDCGHTVYTSLRILFWGVARGDDRPVERAPTRTCCVHCGDLVGVVEYASGSWDLVSVVTGPAEPSE